MRIATVSLGNAPLTSAIQGLEFLYDQNFDVGLNFKEEPQLQLEDVNLATGLDLRAKYEGNQCGVNFKECPNCGWLFFDKSKNGRRKWCSMQTCGSNVKALEWYHRQKKNSFH